MFDYNPRYDIYPKGNAADERRCDVPGLGMISAAIALLVAGAGALLLALPFAFAAVWLGKRHLARIIAQEVVRLAP